MSGTGKPTSTALPAPSTGISVRRQLGGAVVAVVGLGAVAGGLAPRRDEVLLSTPVLLALSVVVAVAIIGGIRPALPAAVGGFLLLNLVFTQPYGTFDVHRLDQGLALGVYLATAVAVSLVVGVAARRHDEAVRAGAEAAELSELAGSGAGAQLSLDEVLERVRTVFGVGYAAVVDPAGRVLRSAGAADGAGSELRLQAAGDRALLVQGRSLSADDRRVLVAFAGAAVTALERQELASQAAEAARLATIDQLRTTLVAGVGHDLRTPLAGIKAAVTSLRAEDVVWTDEQRAELLAAVESSADRLDALVANLLASSRLDVGALSVDLAPVDVEEIVGRGIGRGRRVAPGRRRPARRAAAGPGRRRPGRTGRREPRGQRPAAQRPGDQRPGHRRGPARLGRRLRHRQRSGRPGRAARGAVHALLAAG